MTIQQPAPKYVMWNNYFSCNQCNEPNAVPCTWCTHIEQALRDNLDSGFIKPGVTVNVPITPVQNIWAEVHISSDEIAPGIARMEMLYKPEFANLKKVDIGFWSQGEGLMVMRSCIIDYIRAKCAPGEDVLKLGPIKTVCPSTVSHNLQARRWMTNVAEGDITEKWVCLWNIIMEGACTYCVQLSTNPTNSGLDNKPPPAPWNPIQNQRDQCGYMVQVTPRSRSRCIYEKDHGGQHRA